MEDDVPGPDGFLFSLNDPLRAEHRRVSDYLLTEEQRASTLPFDAAPWRKLPKQSLPDHIEAVLRRLTWLYQHDTELESAHLARVRLCALLRVLYGIRAPFSEPQLRTLLDLTAPLVGRIGPFGIFNRIFAAACRPARPPCSHSCNSCTCSFGSMNGSRWTPRAVGVNVSAAMFEL